MKTWHRIGTWLLLIMAASLAVPGVDPWWPILLAAILIGGLEISLRAWLRRRAPRITLLR
jgi:hypothetical protein